MNLHQPNGQSTREFLLSRIAAGRPISDQVFIVTAHPDDEIIGMGGVMAHFRDLTIIQLSNGAPMDLDHIRAAGASTPEEYANTRRREVLDALAVCAPQLSRFVCLEFVDGELRNKLSAIVSRLEAELVAATAVFTHPYEGGHIDHDVAAYAVQAACRNLNQKGCKAPERFEFASYHSDGGVLRTGEFWSHEGALEAVVPLSPTMLWRRELGFACHHSQKNNLRAFGFRYERLRVAPVYDFESAPPPGATLYGQNVLDQLTKAIRSCEGADRFDHNRHRERVADGS